MDTALTGALTMQAYEMYRSSGQFLSAVSCHFPEQTAVALWPYIQSKFRVTTRRHH